MSERTRGLGRSRFALSVPLLAVLLAEWYIYNRRVYI